MSRSTTAGRKALLAVLAGCALVLPATELALATPASAAYPDVAGEPVPFGDAGSYGSLAGVRLDAPVVGMASTPSGKGYWMVGADGGIFPFGDAGALGSMGGRHLSAPVVGMAATPDGGGYWLVASDGGIFSYGDARFSGSMGGHRLNQPVVGMARTRDGGGYWLVAADGGVFSFGDAAYDGSLGALHLAAPIVAMAVSATGHGYWMTAADGGVFSFGDAPYLGSMGGQGLLNPVAAMAPTPDGGGYWLLPSTAVASASLKTGSTGPAVLALQQRLAGLGYWVGTPNGSFGDSTQQAVWAVQKAAGLPRTGVVDLPTEEAISAGVVPQPRSTSGYVVEIDLEDDLLMVVTNGHPGLIFNTSTGGGYRYTQDGVTAVADTPVGHFAVYRQVNGLVVDSLGSLWRPKFFDAGFAIHGDTSVPPVPVSHGCARISNEAINWVWANNVLPIGTAVWVY
ncbi:MAG TPA: L,D-transpeptidase family protein [Acidimicrobiales bacterium]|nr:L,D-transpeptidase family protein [Acidimicrobiales bacterium]